MGHLIALYIKMQTTLEDNNCATILEYALMVSFIAMVAFAAATIIGTNLNVKSVPFAGLFP